MYDVAILGGGASAVCLLDELARLDKKGPGVITIFEPSKNLWRGRPFQCDITAVRVNAPPEEMSVRCGDTGHFERWLAEHGDHADESFQDPYCGASFVSRTLFGDYLEDCAETAQKRLCERGWRIRLVRELVVAGTATVDGIELKTEYGRRFHAGHAVLCVGGGSPADPYGLSGADGFVAEPYPLATSLGDVPRDAQVAVVGSGLTGVDVALSLAARGHRGRIALLSRTGVLPGVRQRPIPYTLSRFTPEWFRAAAARGEVLTLRQVADLMREEFRAAGESPDPIIAELASLTREEPLHRLRRNLGEVDSASRALRILQRSVPDTGPDIWPLLTEADRDEVSRAHYRALLSMCCPMPPASAAALLAMADAGQLEIVCGLQHVEPRPGGGFRIWTRAGSAVADTVVNAVNAPAHKIPPAARPLVTSLVAAGLAEFHPHAGVSVERATSRTTVGGRPIPSVYVLGDLAAGSLFFTFGIPSLVDRAHDIAGALPHAPGTYGRETPGPEPAERLSHRRNLR